MLFVIVCANVYVFVGAGGGVSQSVLPTITLYFLFLQRVSQTFNVLTGQKAS